MKTIRFALLAVASVLSATAFAEDGVRTQQVSLAGLDLSRPAGAAVAYRRIKSAAESVCRDLSSGMGVRRPIWTNCVANAVSRAVADVNVPTLTAYHAERARKINKSTRVAAR